MALMLTHKYIYLYKYIYIDLFIFDGAKLAIYSASSRRAKLFSVLDQEEEAIHLLI